MKLCFDFLPLLETTKNLRRCLKCLFSIVLIEFFTSFPINAQSEIPLGAWRLHISYNSINSIAVSDQKVFGAARNGVMVIDRSDKSIETYTKLTGLSGTGITNLNYDQERRQLLVVYEDGKIDVIKDDVVTSLDPTRNSALSGSKKINHISIHEDLAYLSADFGVILFDLVRGEVKETWRDIGANGSTLKIFESTFKGDSIFLATDRGVLAGELNTNLLDYTFWKKFDSAEFSDSIISVAAFNDKVYAAVSGTGLFRYESGVWTKQNILQDVSLKSLDASPTGLFISGDSALWRLSSDNIFSKIEDDLLHEPTMAVEENNQLWIADDENGIVSNPAGTFVSYLPNGPSNSRAFNLSFSNKILYLLGGGYSSEYTPLGSKGRIDQFSQGSWSQQSSSLLDLTDIAFNSDTDLTYISSFGYGIEERNMDGSLKTLDENNSPLINTNFPSRSVMISSIERASDGLWVANYGAPQPLHFLSDQNSWESYSFSVAASRYPLKLAVDFFNSLWVVLNPAQGGGVLVFNKDENANRYLSNVDGSGGLPNKAVRSIAIDREGLIWLGTDEGVCYFYSTDEVFSSGVDAVNPIFENRFLLRDDKVTAISVDGGNRKWIGTERGVWLFSPNGEKLFYNFTAENSPLLSNAILDIEINDETGEVFFATDQGLVSFRADATESTQQFQTLKIFPNPVTPSFQGTVSISGLATDAIVKITDISGKLIWETRAYGGTASWNMTDYSGRRAKTGIYLVFSSSSDGAETAVGKIAVIE
jgi:hypothetical protein